MLPFPTEDRWYQMLIFFTRLPRLFLTLSENVLINWGGSLFSECESRYCKIRSLNIGSISVRFLSMRSIIRATETNSTSLNFFFSRRRMMTQRISARIDLELATLSEFSLYLIKRLLCHVSNQRSFNFQSFLLWLAN